ncbi:proline-rich protein 33 [Hyperolius riggenbachi]|uniref:proline-rich protein 33 n=1 Tax=Hyperolius riggenbachi TaxID=752182 RepID=UPI0035A27837
MLLTVTPLEDPGPPSPAPPPLAPKPGKDNARLQRLLRKAAKRAGAQPPPTQTPKAFRSTLSPVNEGDLESPEPAGQQKHLPPQINLPPRFQIKGITHRVPSPYPKQHTFTFTVCEQQIINQYLSPSPIPDTPSPRPSGSSTQDNPFLFPPGGSASDPTSQRAYANVSPRPCTPRHVAFSPTPTKQPAVPLIQISDLPVILVPDSEPECPRLIPPNKDEVINESQNNTMVSSAESGHSSLKSPLPDQEKSTYTSISCISVNLENKQTPQQAPSAEVTNSSGVLECSRVAELPCSRSAFDSGKTDMNQIPIAAHTTDGGLPMISEVKSKTLPPVDTSPPKTVETPKKTPSQTDKSASLKVTISEENILKTPERPKPPRKKPGGGWARLMKHLVVEPEEQTFPEPQKAEEKNEKTAEGTGTGAGGTQPSKGLRANKMWDALLYHMTTSKGPEKSGPTSGSTQAPPSLPFLRSRLPLLLHRPRFDARKLKEAASKPLRKVTAFFHRRIADKAPTSTFNRTASGWSLRAEDAEQENKAQENAVDGENVTTS